MSILLFIKQQRCYANCKSYVGKQKKTLQKPVHALFSERRIFLLNQRTDFYVSLYICRKSTNSWIEPIMIEMFCFNFDHKHTEFGARVFKSNNLQRNLQLILKKDVPTVSGNS